MKCLFLPFGVTERQNDVLVLVLSTEGGDVAQLVRASDRHAADASLIPSAARDFSPRVNFQCRLLRVSIHPCVKSHALTLLVRHPE